MKYWLHTTGTRECRQAFQSSQPVKLRRHALSPVKKHYGADPGERFGPTLAAEHVAENHQVKVDAEILGQTGLFREFCTLTLYANASQNPSCDTVCEL
jgi:hypothetical protein